MEEEQKKVKRSTARRSKASATPVGIHVGAASRRLLPEQIVKRSAPKARLPRIILVALALGLVAGTAVIFYLNTNKIEPGSDTPEITVPAPEPAATPTSTSQTTPPAPAAGAEAQATQMVIISDTPTGFLNVRTGPGTGYAKIGQVKPGEIFELVKEVQDWYEIKLSGGTGYVTKQYAKLK